MSLTIVSAAYALATVGLYSIGGSEQILSLINRALIAAGRRSIVIAGEGSQLAEELISTGLLPQELNDDVHAAAKERTHDARERALRDYIADLIHLHALDFCRISAAYQSARSGHSAPAASLVSGGDLRWRPSVALRIGRRGVLVTRCESAFRSGAFDDILDQQRSRRQVIHCRVVAYVDA